MTNGAGQIPTEFLQEVKDLVIAYDNDLAGNLMAQRVKSQLSNSVRVSPKAVDWNEDLVNMFDWSSKSQNNEIKKYPQHGQERDRGWSR